MTNGGVERRTRDLPRRARAWLLVALLPVMFLWPAFGEAAWIHSHGQDGEHVHLLPGEVAAHDSSLDTWHELLHRAAAEDEDRLHGFGLAPSGVLIALPEFTCAARGSSAMAEAAPAGTVPLPPARLDLDDLDRVARPALGRPDWPPRFGSSRRSAIAALLRSSHAILI